MLIENGKIKILDSDKYSFFSCLFSGALLYCKWIFEWIINPDTIWNGILYKDSYGWEDSLGRIGLRYFASLKSFFILPSLTVVFCIVVNSVLAVLLCRIFIIKNKFLSTLTGIIVSCSPSFCSLLTYYYTSDAYMFACLCSVLFVFFIKNRGKMPFIISVILLSASLFLYQAYLGTAISLSLFYLIYNLLIDRPNLKDYFSQVFRFMIGGIAAICLYFVIYKIVCFTDNITPTASRSFSTMGKLPLSELPLLLINAYRSFFDYYISDNLFMRSFMNGGIINAFLFLSCFFATLILSIKQKLSKTEAIIIVVFLFLAPLATMSISIYAYGTSLYDVTGIIMIPHFNYIYVYIIALVSCLNFEMKNTLISFIKKSILCLVIAVCMIQSMYVQIFAMCVEKDVKQTDTVSQLMISKIYDISSEQDNIKVAIIGDFHAGNFPDAYPELREIVKGTAAVYGCFWADASGSENCWINYLKQFKGVCFTPCNNDEIRIIETSDRFEKMTIFPSDGSVVLIDDIVVVKLS